MEELLRRCDKKLRTLPCCHTDDRKCYCYNCLNEGFYGRHDTYDCEKKMNYYVLNYGPSYASEIYHYLSHTKILESFDFNRKLKILSLGCGFAPDLLVITRYVQNKHLLVQFEYDGIEQSNSWNKARYSTHNATFIEDDVTRAINLYGYDFIFIVKLFSTLYKNKLSVQFLNNFKKAVSIQLKKDCIVVFNDINSIHMGRDIFHYSVKPLFYNIRQFFFGDPPFKDQKWVKIPNNNIVFSIPQGLSVRPLKDISKTVIFEYRNKK